MQQNSLPPGLPLEAHLQSVGLISRDHPVRRGLEMLDNMSKVPNKSNLQGAVQMKSSPRHVLDSEKDRCYQHCRLVCNEAIFTMDRDWRVSSFSEGAQQLFGYSSAEVTGLPLDLLLKDRTAELIRIKQFLDTAGDVQEFESVMLGKSGSEIPVRMSASFLKEPDGRLNGLVALCPDLTPNRELKTAIEQRDRFFASILRNSADAIFTLDPEEKITSWNKELKRSLDTLKSDQEVSECTYRHRKKTKNWKISALPKPKVILRSYKTRGNQGW
jgi:PAS domain S-box-containing protein